MKRLWNIIVAIALAACLYPTVTSAQSANETIRAFEKLEARISTGISLRVYSEMLANAKFELKSFEDSQKSKSQADTLNSLKAAYLRHAEAITLWSISIDKYGSPFVSESSELGKELIRRYPDLTKPGGGGVSSSLGIYYESILPYIWKEAATHVETAKIHLAKSEKRKVKKK